MLRYKDASQWRGGKRSDAQPLTGIRQLVHVMATRPWQLIQASLVFTLACLPIITIPLACSALCRVCDMLMQRRICNPWHDFPRAMIQDWKRVMCAGWTLLAFQVVAFTGIVFCARAGGPGGDIAMMGFILIFVLFCMAATYVFPLIWATDLHYRNLVRDSLLLTMVRLPRNMLVLLAGPCLIVITALLVPDLLCILLLLAWGPLALVHVWNASEGIRQYVIVGRPSA